MAESRKLDEEVDVWWGSYAGRTMLPSFVVCLILTMLIDLVCWLVLPRFLLRWSVIFLGALVWGVQLFRWLYRVLGYNYRLTNRRLFVEHGLVSPVTSVAELAHVRSVKVGVSLMHRRLGVGRVAVYLDDATQLPLVLDGVHHPRRLAELIEQTLSREKKD